MVYVRQRRTSPLCNPQKGVNQLEKKFVGVRLKAIRGQSMGAQQRHDFRDRSPGYIEIPAPPEVLMGGKFDIKKASQEMAEKYKAEQGRKLPSTTRQYITGVIYFSRHQVEKVMAAPGGLKAMNERAIRWVKDFAERIGSQVRYLVRHDDETVSHYQFALDNVVGGKTVMRNLTREELSGLQTSIAETYAGLGFERGKKGSRDRHKTIGQMHAAEFLGFEREKENLKKEIYELKLAITESQKIAAELKQQAHQERAQLKKDFIGDLREMEKLWREIEEMKKKKLEMTEEAKQKQAELLKAKEKLFEEKKILAKETYEAKKRGFKSRWDLDR